MAKRKTFYVPAAIFEGDRSAYAVAVYAYLCFCADKSGVCFPGMNTIAQKCGMSRSSVNRTLKKLEETGMIRMTATAQPTGSGRVRRGTNRYRILHTPVPSDTVPHVTQNTSSVSQGHDPHVTENREINNNSKAIMGDVPSVGIIGANGQDRQDCKRFDMQWTSRAMPSCHAVQRVLNGMQKELPKFDSSCLFAVIPRCGMPSGSVPASICSSECCCP